MGFREQIPGTIVQVDYILYLNAAEEKQTPGLIYTAKESKVLEVQ
jgi:hypothetical protein